MIVPFLLIFQDSATSTHISRYDFNGFKKIFYIKHEYLKSLPFFKPRDSIKKLNSCWVYELNVFQYYVCRCVTKLCKREHSVTVIYQQHVSGLCTDISIIFYVKVKLTIVSDANTRITYVFDHEY